MNELMVSEIWKDIPEYKGLYQISNLGNVRSLSRIVKGYKSNYLISTRNKKKTINSVGYEIVGLWKNNIQNIALIHRLVANAFIENPNNYPEINHIDGNKANNDISNLEWCSGSMNVQHAYNTGLSSRNKPVECVETGRVFRSQSEAARVMNVCQAAIGHAVRNGTKSCGYHWKFKETKK